MNDDTNTIPEDDAEGHKHRFKGVTPAEDDTEDDAEGHKHRYKGITPAEDDTEGHRYVPRDERPSVGDVPDRSPKSDSDDDAEGHGRWTP